MLDLSAPLTPEHRDALREIIGMANENNKFAIQLGLSFPLAAQVAVLEAMQVQGWIRLIDISPITVQPDRLFRVFALNQPALDWRKANAD